MTRLPLAIATAATLALLGLSGCVANPASDDGATRIDVTSTADDCVLSATAAQAGSVVFAVTNSGDAVTEFYVLGSDGERVVGEVENIGPGTSRELVVTVEPGTYFTVCKPGMAGDGVGKAEFTVAE